MRISEIANPVEASAVRKTIKRLLWFLFVLYVISYLDRINIAFAALSMNKSLGLSATEFGIASTIFYIAYVACEIPSNLLMVRFGARRWLARILLTWGVISACTMFIDSKHGLYTMRLLLGVAEAGFMPGVLLYMTDWFPERIRARVLAVFIIAQPVAVAGGAAISGYILDLHGLLGVEGWRWLFLLEGLPAVLLGGVAYFYLCDGPLHANWLQPAERVALQTALRREEAQQDRTIPLWRQLATREVVLLCIAYFCLVNSLNASATWTPQIVGEVMKTYAFSSVGLISAIPALATIAFVPLIGISSDQTGERCWHTVGTMLLAAFGWGIVILARSPELRLVGLICAFAGGFAAMSMFWTLPLRALSSGTKAAGLALISSVGLLGSAASPLVIGLLRDHTGLFAAGLLYIMALLVISAALIVVVAALRAEPESMTDGKGSVNA